MKRRRYEAVSSIGWSLARSGNPATAEACNEIGASFDLMWIAVRHLCHGVWRLLVASLHP